MNNTLGNVPDIGEQKSKSLAKSALKEGLRDTLTVFMQAPTEMQKKLNDQLANNNFPNFNQLVSAIRNTPQKVIKRGKIKNLDEYYIIKELPDDLTFDISQTYR